MKNTSILAVDDDPQIRTVIRQYLEGDGYTVHTAENAAEALKTVREHSIDLILLDMILPDTDGLNLMAEFRGIGKTPIIVVSGKSDPTDRIVGLEMGADDYLIKPFYMRELSARIKSVLRRAESGEKEKEEENRLADGNVTEVFSFGRWTMNCNKYEVSNGNGHALSLTSGEFELLHALVQAPNRVLKRDQLFEMTRGSDYDSYDRAVDIQIGRLRKKLNDDPRNPSLIKTVRGVGYIFIADVKKAPASGRI